MKVLFVNTTCGRGSHGKICVQLAKEYIAQGHECIIAYGRDSVPVDFKKYSYKIGNKLSIYSHVLLTRLFDMHGLGSIIATKRFIKWAERYNPDLLWLHNIHGYFLNYEILFRWIKSRPNMEVKWTLHDCWAITGHCTNFESCKCKKWLVHCRKCCQQFEYPNSCLFDNSYINFLLKKKAFTGVRQLTIYTPSEWLAKRIKRSYLGRYKIHVMPNPVDKVVFRYRESNFRNKYGLEKKFVILGVANAWQKSKGLYDFIKLSNMLNDDFKIILVGLSQKQIKEIPSNIICICHTSNAIELAEIYSAADVFVNPSKEETFGMTAYEAALCGTKVIVYKGTACEEVAKKYGGIVIDQNVKSIYNAIIDLKKKGSNDDII